MTRARLDPVLDEVRNRLVPLVSRAPTASAGRLRGAHRFAEAEQWDLCRRLLAAMGFDFERGRLDRSTHPFTLFAGADDVRLTIRVDETDLPAAVLTALHEGGHGLYDQGFDPDDRDTLLGEAPEHGPARIAGAPVGKPCRPQPRVLGLRLPELARNCSPTR